MREEFIETYSQLLNNTLSSHMLNIKEDILRMKSNFIHLINNDLLELIKSKINKNYSNYINFILEKIKSLQNNLEKTSIIVLIFNSKDSEYFNKNISELNDIFKKSIKVEEANDYLIGGFRIKLSESGVIYDYTINNLLHTNSSIIENELLEVISDTKLKEIGKKFEEFIKKQKKSIKLHLQEYDRI